MMPDSPNPPRAGKVGDQERSSVAEEAGARAPQAVTPPVEVALPTPAPTASSPALPADSDDSIGAMYARARQFADDNEPREAVALYRQLLARDPRHIRARNNLALLLEKTGDIDGALAELDKAISFDEDNVSVLCNRAAILIARMRYERAEQDLV